MIEIFSDKWMKSVKKIQEKLRLPKEKSEIAENTKENKFPLRAGAFANTKVRNGFIIGGAVLVLFLLVFIMLGVYASSLDTVFPNVTLHGVDVSGMDVKQAATVLNRELTNDESADRVTVLLPGDVTLEISTVEAGIELSSSSAAQIAVEYGKDKGLFDSAAVYLKCLLSGVNLTPEDPNTLDESVVRAAVLQAVNKANTKGLENSYQVLKKEVKITKGMEEVAIPEDELYKIVVKAFEEQNYEPILFENKNGDKFEELNLQKIYDEIYVEPVDAKYNRETGKSGEHVIGVSFDLKKAEKMYKEAKGGETIEIPLIFTEPKITKEKLGKMLFRDKLSSESTYLSGDWARVTNIELSAAAVNGTILNPGDEFSFNDVVGERTTDKGYAAAPAYVGGKTVDEVGGGICQTSSTIYCCALYADLQITDRSEHMFAVAYLPLGMDATVSWGGPEFKFINNQDYPIKIVTDTSGEYLTVEFWGTKLDDKSIEIESVMTSETDYKVIHKEVDSLPPGETETEVTGYTGYTADTYKCVYDGDGNLLTRDYITTSVYDKRDEVILVGKTPKPSKKTTAASSTEY